MRSLTHAENLNGTMQDMSQVITDPGGTSVSVASQI